jgi:hypothetical protein
MPSFPNTIAVGTTKHSVAKFWCGIGVLEKDEECYNQIILTPNQIKAKKLKRKEVCIDGLVGKNFKAIGIL